MEIVRFIFQDFWHFIGAMAILGIPFNFAINFMKHMNISKHGWPPSKIKKEK